MTATGSSGPSAFKSVLVEGGEALAAVAAYIELNPVRAGLCADPKDYRYCGYAEALAKGSGLAREGIRTILGQPETISWKELSCQYRKYLFLPAIIGCAELGAPSILAQAIGGPRRVCSSVVIATRYSLYPSTILLLFFCPTCPSSPSVPLHPPLLSRLWPEWDGHCQLPNSGWRRSARYRLGREDA
jgi:hypothetical protein